MTSYNTWQVGGPGGLWYPGTGFLALHPLKIQSQPKLTGDITSSASSSPPVVPRGQLRDWWREEGGSNLTSPKSNKKLFILSLLRHQSPFIHVVPLCQRPGWLEMAGFFLLSHSAIWQALSQCHMPAVLQSLLKNILCFPLLCKPGQPGPPCPAKLPITSMAPGWIPSSRCATHRQQHSCTALPRRL